MARCAVHAPNSAGLLCVFGPVLAVGGPIMRICYLCSFLGCSQRDYRVECDMRWVGPCVRAGFVGIEEGFREQALCSGVPLNARLVTVPFSSLL